MNLPFKKSSLAAAIALGMAFGSGIAQAEDVKEIGTSWGASTGGLVLPVNGQQNYWAGLQTIEVKSPPVTPLSFLAYCVDPFQYAPTSFQPYTNTNFASFFGARATDISKLYSMYYASTIGSNTNAAAFQLALWEVANDDGNLGSGVVQTVGATNTTIAFLALTMLGNFGSYSGPAAYSFTLYTNGTPEVAQRGYQDYLVATPVPEPGTYAMLLAGLGLMGLVVRKRRQG